MWWFKYTTSLAPIPVLVDFMNRLLVPDKSVEQDIVMLEDHETDPQCMQVCRMVVSTGFN